MPAARCLVVAAFSSLLAAGFAQPRTPVLVELFTSEGCSSCPPADQLLEKLDSQVIVLSEHVDYWDHQGWKDPFSSHQTTVRQQAYGRILNVSDIYTPQMIVDGETSFVGNDGGKAVAAIRQAAGHKKAEVRLSRTEAGLEITVDAAPGAADLYLAMAEDSATSNVSAGENDGKRLHHVAVLRSLKKVGSVKRGATFNRLVELPRGTGSQRAIVFLQEPGPGRVSGVAVAGPAGR